MALPKIATPTFELIQPSTKEKILYRPFLVREEKIFLMAKESGKKEDIFNSIKKIINACVQNEGFDVDQIPIFDMEYIFLKLRAVSVDNIVKFKVKDSDDDEEYSLQLDLNDVEVTFPENHEKKIMVDDTIGFVLKYPTPEISEKILKLETFAEITYHTIMNCVDYVFDENEVYPWNQSSDDEKEEFLNSLPVEVYEKIKEFFESAPHIEYVVTYKNSEDVEKKVIFRDLDDFFMLY